MPISKPFAIATEGATTDGRVIDRQWLVEMATQYDPKSFTALGNLEHYIAASPDSQFSPYGKVISLSTREADILGQKKLQLLAVFDAKPELVAFQKAGKKLFASMEVNPKFSDSGKAYLTGLAFTDNPASLGTEVMAFAAQAKANPFAARKHAADNLFSAAEEITIEWEAEETKPSEGANLFNKVKELLGLGKKETADQFADAGKAIEIIALSQKGLLENFASLDQQIADINTTIKLSETTLASHVSEFAELKKTLGQTADQQPNRPNATGGNGQAATDC